MRRNYYFLLLVGGVGDLLAQALLAQAPLTLPETPPATATPPTAVVTPAAVPEVVPAAPSMPSLPAGSVVSAAPGTLSQSIFLDVKDLGTNLSSNANWRSVWGSYSKNTTRARALEINLRNPAKISGEYLVEWYFFATPVRGGKRFLFDRDSKTVTIGPGGIEKATVVSDELQSRTVHYGYDYSYYYYNTYKTGMKPEGWIVTVSIGGKVVRVKSSAAQLDELFKKTDEFKAMTSVQK